MHILCKLLYVQLLGNEKRYEQWKNVCRYKFNSMLVQRTEMVSQGKAKRTLIMSSITTKTGILQTCFNIEFATPRVHIRVGAEWSTAVHRWIVCKISKVAVLSSIWTMSLKHKRAFTLTCQHKKNCSFSTDNFTFTECNGVEINHYPIVHKSQGCIKIHIYLGKEGNNNYNIFLSDVTDSARISLLYDLDSWHTKTSKSTYRSNGCFKGQTVNTRQNSLLD